MKTYQAGEVPEFEAPIVNVRRGDGDRAWLSVAVRTTGGNIEGFCSDECVKAMSRAGYSPAIGDTVRVLGEFNIAYKSNSARWVSMVYVPAREAAAAAAAKA